MNVLSPELLKQSLQADYVCDLGLQEGGATFSDVLNKIAELSKTIPETFQRPAIVYSIEISPDTVFFGGPHPMGQLKSIQARIEDSPLFCHVAEFHLIETRGYVWIPGQRGDGASELWEKIETWAVVLRQALITDL